MNPNERHAGLIVLSISASLALGCGYNANANKRNASRQDFSTTTTTGAYTWNSELGNGTSSEEEAERREREERETQERQERARAVRPSADEQAPGAGSASLTLEERDAFAQKLRGQLSTLDSDVDDIRSRAAMAGAESRARVDAILKEVAAGRAQLEQARKRLEISTGADAARARDDAQKLLDETKARVHAARDAM
jgi:hypothetical protein